MLNDWAEVCKFFRSRKQIEKYPLASEFVGEWVNKEPVMSGYIIMGSKKRTL